MPLIRNRSGSRMIVAAAFLSIFWGHTVSSREPTEYNIFGGDFDACTDLTGYSGMQLGLKSEAGKRVQRCLLWQERQNGKASDLARAAVGISLTFHALKARRYDDASGYLADFQELAPSFPEGDLQFAQLRLMGHMTGHAIALQAQESGETSNPLPDISGFCASYPYRGRCLSYAFIVAVSSKNHAASVDLAIQMARINPEESSFYTVAAAANQAGKHEMALAATDLATRQEAIRYSKGTRKKDGFGLTKTSRKPGSLSLDDLMPPGTTLTSRYTSRLLVEEITALNGLGRYEEALAVVARLTDIRPDTGTLAGRQLAKRTEHGLWVKLVYEEARARFATGDKAFLEKVVADQGNRVSKLDLQLRLILQEDNGDAEGIANTRRMLDLLAEREAAAAGKTFRHAERALTNAAGTLNVKSPERKTASVRKRSFLGGQGFKNKKFGKSGIIVSSYEAVPGTDREFMQLVALYKAAEYTKRKMKAEMFFIQASKSWTKRKTQTWNGIPQGDSWDAEFGSEMSYRVIKEGSDEASDYGWLALDADEVMTTIAVLLGSDVR